MSSNPRRRTSIGREMLAISPTIKRKGRKWKVWVVDETDVTITVRVRPLRVMSPAEFTFPFRNEFRCFDDLAAEAIDRYLEAQASSKRPPPPLRLHRLWRSYIRRRIMQGSLESADRPFSGLLLNLSGFCVNQALETKSGR